MLTKIFCFFILVGIIFAPSAICLYVANHKVAKVTAVNDTVELNYDPSGKNRVSLDNYECVPDDYILTDAVRSMHEENSNCTTLYEMQFVKVEGQPRDYFIYDSSNVEYHLGDFLSFYFTCDVQYYRHRDYLGVQVRGEKSYECYATKFIESTGKRELLFAFMDGVLIAKKFKKWTHTPRPIELIKGSKMHMEGGIPKRIYSDNIQVAAIYSDARSAESPFLGKFAVFFSELPGWSACFEKCFRNGVEYSLTESATVFMDHEKTKTFIVGNPKNFVVMTYRSIDSVYYENPLLWSGEDIKLVQCPGAEYFEFGKKSFSAETTLSGTTQAVYVPQAKLLYCIKDSLPVAFEHDGKYYFNPAVEVQGKKRKSTSTST